MWMRANEWWPPDARISSLNVPGEGKVCWICRIREVDPEWRPGLEVPELTNQSKFKP